MGVVGLWRLSRSGMPTETLGLIVTSAIGIPCLIALVTGYGLLRQALWAGRVAQGFGVLLIVMAIAYWAIGYVSIPMAAALDDISPNAWMQGTYVTMAIFIVTGALLWWVGRVLR
jgi:hypothetical protein